MTKMGRQEETRLSGQILVDFPGQDLAPFLLFFITITRSAKLCFPRFMD